MQREQIAIAGTAEDSAHLDLLCWRDSRERLWTAQ